jgi:hypothetical protein
VKPQNNYWQAGASRLARVLKGDIGAIQPDHADDGAQAAKTNEASHV